MRFSRLLLIICTIFLNGCLNDDYELKIVHTNDLHSHLLPFNEFGDCPLDSAECLGGFHRIAGFLQYEKKNKSAPLIVDAGDRFTGTPFYTLTKSRYLIKTMARMPYDFFVFGNHEFDENIIEVEKFIRALNVPTLASNLKFSPKSFLSSFVQPSQIIKHKGRKIGVIGAIIPDLSPLGLNNMQLEVSDFIPHIKTEVQNIKKQGVDIIILISHIGLENDCRVAKEIPDIDVIVGGHSHSLLHNNSEEVLSDGAYPLLENNGKTLIVSAGMGGQYVGVLNLKFNKQGQIIEFSGDTVPMDITVPTDKIVSEYIAAAEQDLSDILEQTIAYNEQNLGFTENKDYCSEECAIGEFLTSSLQQAFPYIDGVILNSGAIRGGLPQGIIKFKHLVQSYPYDTSIAILELSGADLEKYLSHGVENYLSNDRTNELLQTSGISYVFSANEKKAYNIKINNEILDKDRVYRILTSAYVASGGNGYPTIPDAQIMGTSVRETIIQQMQKHGNIKYKLRNNIIKSD